MLTSVRPPLFLLSNAQKIICHGNLKSSFLKKYPINFTITVGFLLMRFDYYAPDNFRVP